MVSLEDHILIIGKCWGNRWFTHRLEVTWLPIWIHWVSWEQTWYTRITRLAKGLRNKFYDSTCLVRLRSSSFSQISLALLISSSEGAEARGITQFFHCSHFPYHQSIALFIILCVKLFRVLSHLHLHYFHTSSLLIFNRSYLVL